jgi:cytochrome bd-type quinol oxidase subunit 2
MRNSRYRYTRLVMIVGAITFGVNAIWLLSSTKGFVDYLGLEKATPVMWPYKILGVVLLALSVHMATTSRQVPDAPFRRAAIVMIFVALALSFLTYKAPGTQTSGRLTFIGIGALFAFLYAITLPIKSIGILEEEQK